MKHGNGLIVTLDGIYYEGAFTQDILTVTKYIYIRFKIFLYNIRDILEEI